MKEPFFNSYTPAPTLLKSFGFIEKNGVYFYQAPIATEMSLEIAISNGIVDTKIIDLSFGEEYTLHRVKDENGSFITAIRREYQQILNEIRDKCFILDSFTSDDAIFIKTYLLDKYGNILEYLWKTPDAAAVRRTDTTKWYACFMHVARKKVDTFSDSDEIIEAMNLHMKPEDAASIIDFKSIFPGFHMNKKSWFSVILDGTVPHSRITELIDASYNLAKK